jgi:hypothetical protein
MEEKNGLNDEISKINQEKSKLSNEKSVCILIFFFFIKLLGNGKKTEKQNC